MHDPASQLADVQNQLRQAQERVATLEAQLAESGSRRSPDSAARLLWEGIPDALFIHPVCEDGTLGNFIEVSRTACEYLGYSRDELLKMSPADIDVGNDGPPINEIVEGLLQGRDVTFERVHRTKNGQLIPVELHARYLIWNGETCVFSQARVITQRKQTEDMLMLLRAAIETSQDAIVINQFGSTPKDTRIVYANPAFTTMLGYSKQETLGRSPALFLPDHAWMLLVESWRADLEAGRPISTYIKTQRKDGGEIPTFVSVSQIYDRQQNATHMVLLLRDMTEREQQVEQIESMQRFLRNTLDAIPDHVIVLDKEGSLSHVNAAWRRFAQANNLQANEPQDERHYLCICDTSSYQNTQHLDTASQGVKAVASGEKDHFYLEYPTCITGSEMWFALRVAPFAEPAPRRVVITHTPITERVRAERAAQASHDRLDSVLSSIDDVIVSSALPSEQTIYVSQAWERVIGYPFNETLSVPEFFAQVTYPADRPMLEHAQRHAEEHGFHELEQRIVLPDGNQRWLRRRAWVKYDENNTPIRIDEVISDISAYKMAQDNIELQRAILRQTRNAVFLCTLEGQIIFVNASGVAMAQATSEEAVIGRRITDYLVDSDARIFLEVGKPSILAGETWHAEGRLKPSASNPIEVEHTSFVLLNDEGQPRYFATIMVDITVRKKVQRELRISEAKYRSLIESTGAAISMINYSGHYLFVNRIAAQSFGQPPEAIVGQHIQDLWPSAEGQRLLKDVQWVIERGEHKIREIELPKQGKRCWYRMTIEPVNDGAEDAYAALVLAHDITDKKEAEIALRESERLFQQFMKHLPGTVFVFDDENRLTYCNERYAASLGYQPEEIIGKTIDQFLTPDLTKTAAEENTLIRQRNETIEFHYVDDSKGKGEEVYWLVIKFPIPRQILPPLIGAIAIDVTRERRAELVLQRAHDLLEKRVIERTAELDRIKTRMEVIFNSTGDGLLLLGLEHGIQQTNQALNKLFDTVPDNFVGLPLTTLVHPKDVAIVEKTIQAVANDLQTRRIDVLARRPNGSTFDAGVSIAPVRLNNSSQLNLVCTFHDISERSRAQQIIAEERNLLRTLVDTIPDYIYIKNSHGHMLLSNAAHLRSLGAEQMSDVMGKTDQDLFPKHLADKFMSDDTRVLSGSQIINVEERTIAEDGTETWAMTTKAPFYNLKGEIAGLVGITRDISQIKLNEEALRQSEEKFRLFLEVAPIAALITNQEGYIILVNERAEALFGYPREDMIGKPIEMLIPQDTRGKHAALRETYNQMPRIRQMAPARDVFGLRCDGSTFPIEIELSYIQTANEMLILSFMNDLTKRKRAEETLIKALAQEKELGDLKSRFVTMASHEFRTPLAAILATAETLSVYRDKMTQAQMNNRLEKIRQQVLHMRDIMEDVLQLARIQTGRIEFNPVEANLDVLCRETCEDLESQPEYRGRIHYTSEADDVVLRFDPRLMRQAVTNLLSNALKYSAAERPVYVNLVRDEHDIRLTVQDEGIGIPDADLKHLFEPFHRGKNVGTISGTGLGLSITKQAIELHSGTLNIESQVGQGTHATIHIPLPMKEKEHDQDTRA